MNILNNSLLKNISYLSLTLGLLFIVSSCNSTSSSTIEQTASATAKGMKISSAKHTLGPKYIKKMPLTVAEEVEALGEGRPEIPLELNNQVLNSIDYFLNDSRRFMINSLSRGESYIPMMKAILKQKGLPEDLVYVAMIESGFRNDAVSHAAAVGPWQFISGTGKRYGLTINEWVDERRDPVKSTYAAADYLTDLHDMFNSWPLAIAAYNSGEGKIQRGMNRYGVTNFWDMSSSGPYLARETKGYVPTFLAASILAKHPERYGLSYEPSPPFKWDDVNLNSQVNLTAAAQMAEVSLEEIKALNPHLKRNTTPPGSNFVLRVPPGKGNTFAKAYALASPSDRMSDVMVASVQEGIHRDDRQPYSRQGKTAKRFEPDLTAAKEVKVKTPAKTVETIYVVKAGETPYVVAKKFDLSWPKVAEWNNLPENPTLKVGQKLILRLTPDASGQVTKQASSKGSSEKALSYQVKKGDTLGVIATRHGVTVATLKKTNKLKGNTVRVGQTLKISGGSAVASGSPATLVSVSGSYQVKKGDTLGAIATRHGMTVESLKKANNLKNNTVVLGQTLKVSGDSVVAGASSISSPKASTLVSDSYQVKKGDTLGAIATRHGMTVESLKKANNLKSNTVVLGQILKVSGDSVVAGASSISSPKISTLVSGSYQVKKGDTLGAIATRHGMTVESLKKANNLKSNTVVLGQTLKVSGDSVVAGASSISSPKISTLVSDSYQVKQGDTLGAIAARHGMTVESLKKANNLKSNTVVLGQTLKVSGDSVVAGASSISSPKISTLVSDSYQVKQGDTLGAIAARHGMTVESLKKANNLKSNTVVLGQTLKVSGDSVVAGASSISSPKISTLVSGSYQVKQGDTLGAIATRHGMTVESLKKANNLKSNTVVLGQTLKVGGGSAVVSGKSAVVSSVKSTVKSTSHKVVDGDTLFTIGQKYNISAETLKTLNGLKSNNIRPGQVLKVSK